MRAYLPPPGGQAEKLESFFISAKLGIRHLGKRESENGYMMLRNDFTRYTYTNATYIYLIV